MTKSERIQFRISKENKDFIQKQCDQQDITISQFMTEALLIAYGIKEV